MAALKTLEGIKIVSFTAFLLGPLGTQHLGDMGADVITVETTKGAYERGWAGCHNFKNDVSTFYLTTHRNTRNIALDLKSPEGKEAALRLIKDADVVIVNSRPGAMDRKGLGYEDAKKVNPDIIYVSVTGFGNGPIGQSLPGQDLLLQALTGLADITGKAQEPPTPAGAAIIDVYGALWMAFGVVSAVLHRQRTGEGQLVELNMLQAAMALQIEPLTVHLNGTPVSRNGDGLASGYIQAPYGVYKTSDDKYIVLSSTPMNIYYDAIQDKRLEPYVDKAWTNKKEIHDLFVEIIATKTADEWVEILSKKGVWTRKICNYDECFEEPVVKEIDPVMTVNHPRAGDVKLLKFPIHFSSGEPEVRYFGPELGEHTEEILKGLGYTQDEIDAMVESGAVVRH